MITAGQRIVQTAKKIPAPVRKWAARGLLGASLFVLGPERIRILISALNDYANEKIGDIIDAIPGAIANAIDELEETANAMLQGRFGSLMYLLIAGFLGVVAITLFFDAGPKLNFAGFGSVGRPKHKRKR